MSESRLIYKDEDGIRRTAIADSDRPGKLIVLTQQDIEGTLAMIEQQREIDQRGATNKKVATMPVFVMENLKQRGIWDDPDAFDKWLNSSEATPWRVWGGSV